MILIPAILIPAIFLLIGVMNMFMRMMMIVYVLITQMFGGCFVYCSLYAVNQAQVQRLLSLPSLKAGQAALWLQVNPSESI